jgi:hypothetical protein
VTVYQMMYLYGFRRAAELIETEATLDSIQDHLQTETWIDGLIQNDGYVHGLEDGLVSAYGY